jgi:hypothetical protein
MKSGLMYINLCLFCLIAGCSDNRPLAESSFGPLGDENAKASPASVISMGRDDDDGKAQKWHIGGK